MSNNLVANDFSTINRRAAEIRKEMQDALGRGPVISCTVCDGIGWMRAMRGPLMLFQFVVCENCHNPERKPMP